MNVDFFEVEELQVRLADEQLIREREPQLLNSYYPLDNADIHFHEVFDVDQS